MLAGPFAFRPPLSAPCYLHRAIRDYVIEYCTTWEGRSGSEPLGGVARAR
jgi:hypothetical protein